MPTTETIIDPVDDLETERKRLQHVLDTSSNLEDLRAAETGLRNLEQTVRLAWQAEWREDNARRAREREQRRQEKATLDAKLGETVRTFYAAVDRHILPIIAQAEEILAEMERAQLGMPYYLVDLMCSLNDFRAEGGGTGLYHFQKRRVLPIVRIVLGEDP